MRLVYIRYARGPTRYPPRPACRTVILPLLSLPAHGYLWVTRSGVAVVRWWWWWWWWWRRSGVRMTTEELELAEHCSFRPRTNHFTAANGKPVDAAIDAEDPHTHDLMSALHATHPPRANGEQSGTASTLLGAAGIAAGASVMSGMGTASRPPRTGGGDLSGKYARRGLSSGYSDGIAAWRERSAPEHAGWGVYAPPMPGSHTSVAEADVARALQGEIEREVARLSELETPAAAAATAASAAVASAAESSSHGALSTGFARE